jgi:hypothetical protein
VASDGLALAGGVPDGMTAILEESREFEMREVRTGAYAG